MKFFRFIALRPYGSTLCSPSAQMWITAVSVCVAIMASTEAVAWGYVGHFLGTEWAAYAIGSVTGAIAFVVVWALDSTFVTLDLRRGEYERRLAGLKHQRVLSTRIQTFVRAIRGAGAGLVTRLLLAAGSLAISAPFLTQLLFSHDIDRVLDTQFALNRAAARQTIQRSAHLDVQTTMNRLESLRKQLVEETAGHGPSGRFGYGPTATTLAKDITDAEQKLTEATRSERERLLAFDALTRDQVTKAYGIANTTNALQTRTAALEQVKKQPGFLRSELTIAAFLFGIFLAIVVLKGFEPHSAEIYYSEYCQDRFACYLKGDFDDLLPTHEKASSGGRMTPMRFDEWLETDYTAHEDRTRRETQRATILSQLQSDEDGVAVIRTAAQQDLVGPMNDEDSVNAEITALEEEGEKVASELSAAEQQIDAHQRSIQNLDDAMRYPNAIETPDRYNRVLDQLEEWNQGLKNYQDTARQLKLQLKLNASRIASRRAYADILKREVANRAETLTRAEAEIAAVRDKALMALRDI